MGQSEGAGKGRRGAHRSEPEHSGPLSAVGRMLESTVPKKVQPPRVLNVLIVSGATLAVVLFSYSTTQIYLRFSEPPVDHGTLPGPASSSGPPAGSGGQDGTGSETRIEDGTGGADRSAAPDSGDSAGVPGDVAYSTVEAHSGGFTGRVTLTNTGTDPMNAWELVLGFSDATVTSAWEVEWEATEGGVIARQPSYAPALAPGDSATVNFVAEGAAQEPVSCTFNGAPCSP